MVWNINIIRVTTVGKCPRRIELAYKGAEELPIHYLQAKGKIVHAVVEDILRGEEPKPDFGILSDAKRELSREVEPLIKNLQDWIENTEYDLSNAQLELELEMNMQDGYILQGHLDLVTPEVIVDFKTSTKRNTLANRMQLSAYKILAEHNNVAHDPKLVNVFLGGKTYREYELTPEEIERATILFMDSLEQHKGMLELIKKGHRMPCHVSFECVFCPFRHICSGF